MAQVPFSGLLNEGVSTGPIGRQQVNATPASFGGGLAEGLTDVGSSLVQRGEMLAQHANFFQQVDNKAASDNAYVGFLNATNTHLYGDGTDQNPGFYNLQGSAAVAALPGTMKALNDAREQAGADLNPAAKLLFDADSRRLLAYSTGDAARHASTERNTYLKNTNDGVVASLTNDSILNYTDPRRVANNLGAIDSAIEHQGGLTGMPPNQVTAMKLKAHSDLQMGIIERMSDHDPFGAQRYYNAHQSDLSADAIVKLDRYFKTTLSPIEGYNGAQSIIGGYYSIPSASAFDDAIVGHGEHGAAGQVSPKGAMGQGQVMPDTAAAMARQLNIPYDPDKLKTDNDYNKQIRMAYQGNLMREFGGNAALAAAAYNAGPGRVNQWIAQFGDPRKGEISTQDWADKIPIKETHDYVARVSQALGMGPGVIATNTDIKAHLPDWLAQGDNFASYAQPGEPLFPKTVQTQISATVNHISEAQRAAKAEMGQQIYSVINGGPEGKAPKPQNIDQLYAMAPGAKQAWAELEPKTQASYLRLLAQNASGRTVQDTPDSMKRYNELVGEAHNDPSTFVNKDFSTEADLPYARRNALMKMQQAIRDKPPDNSNILHALQVATTAGFNISKKDDPENYNQFTGRLQTDMETFAQVHARKPSDADIRKMTSDLMLTSGGFLGMGGSTEYQSPYAGTVSGIPVKDRAQIVQAHTSKFGTPPSDGQIVYWYNRMKGHGR